MALALRLASSANLKGWGTLLCSSSKTVLRLGRSGTASNSQQVRLQAQREMQGFWEKNINLKRPWSPHLGIYKAELPMLTSLFHRATGIAMAIVWAGFGCAAFAFTGHLDAVLDFVRQLELPRPVIFAGKFVLCWPLVYHYCNGMRHLSWDYALGFSLKTMYKTGYIAAGASILITGFLASLQLAK